MSASGHTAGRLRARPVPVAARMPAGVSALGLGDRRDGLLQVPEREGPAALLVALHGAGSSGRSMAASVAAIATEQGVVLLAPDSRGATWDMIRGGFGPDVGFLDRALERVFATCSIDPARVALGGFSDGASYALSLGLANGDLFTHLIAFSPGFAAPPAHVGRPRVLVTHGDGDRVLPVDRCSRRLVPALRRGGYAVDYHEFAGGHVLPPDLVRRALAWLAGTGRR